MKRVIYILIGLIILAFVILLCFSKPDDVGNTAKTNTSKVNESKSNVVNTNTVKQNVIEEKKNEITEQNTVNELKNEEVATNTTETFVEDVQTEEQKAINVVRRDYGNTGSNTKISVDGISENGSYIIVVRDSVTTEALAYYTVNAQTGEFTKKEVY